MTYRIKPVTRQNVANTFGVPLDSVKQCDSMQLFIVKRSFGTVLVSYYTTVGILKDGTWYLTTQRYSVTTSKQLTRFSRGRDCVYTDDLQSLF